jgi:hypothetical protein
MDDQTYHTTDGREPNRQAVYRISVQGKLDEDWSDWLDGMTITFERSTTTLTGPVADQPALRGILDRIWDLNLTLISVTRVKVDAG